MNDREYFLNCLARHVAGLSQDGQRRWAARQNEAMKSDIRERIIRMRSEKVNCKWKGRFGK